MKTLNERLDLIKPKILAPDFRGGRGLGNEINFWIFDYAPVDEMAVRSHVEYLQTSINAEREDTRIVVYDLYEIMLSHLEKKGYLDKVLQMEKDHTDALRLKAVIEKQISGPSSSSGE